MHNDRYLPIGEAAIFLSVSIATLRRWEDEGKILPLRTLSGQRRYTREELEKLKSQTLGDRLLTIRQVAQKLGISTKTVRRLLAKRQLQLAEEGKNRKLLFSEAEVNKILQAEEESLPKQTKDGTPQKGLSPQVGLLTISQAGKKLGVSVKTVRRLVAKGLLHPAEEGKYGKLLFAVSEINKLLKGQKQRAFEPIFLPAVSPTTRAAQISATKLVLANALATLVFLIGLGTLLVAGWGFAPQGLKTDIGKNLASLLGIQPAQEDIEIDKKIPEDITSDRLAELEAVIADFSLHGHSFEKIKLTSGFFESLDASKLTKIDADKIDGIDSNSLLKSDDTDTAEGAINFTAKPGGNGVGGGPVYINPAGATAGYTLFGVAVGSSQRFKVDAEGDVFIEGDLQFIGAQTISTNTGNLTIDSAGSFVVADNTTLQGTLTVEGASTFSSDISVSSGGQLTLTRQPTKAHTGTWAIGSATWNADDATIYVNPTSPTADANIFALAKDGAVQFAVDAEGDIYANNLILAGSTTTGTTTVTGDLSVEGNTTIGDATTDTWTANTATLTWAGGNKTLDITGAATRTLTLLNSTASQVADLDLSDGSLKVGGTEVLSNARSLNNISAIDATTETTIEAAIDTLANLTSAAALATVGTITTGVWTGTSIADANVDNDITLDSTKIIRTTLTTEQLRLLYDASNYLSATVGSTGAVTLDATGAGAAFTISDALTASSTLAVTSTSTLTGAVTMTNGFDSNAASTVAGLTVDGDGNLAVSNGTLSVTAPSTTGNAAAVTANSLTTGVGLDVSSTSTAGGASGVSKLLNLARSGANAQLAHTAYGLYSSVSNTNATSGTNIAGYFSASGATTANYGLIVENGDVGIGTASPNRRLQVNVDDATTNNVTNVLGINHTTSGTAANGIAVGMVFGAEDAAGDLQTAGSIRGILTDVTNNSEKGALALFSASAASDIEVMRLTSDGNVGIGTTGPAYKLDLVGGQGISGSLVVSDAGDLVTNGTFGSNITGWTNSSTGSESIAWNAGGYMDLISSGAGYARADQQITTVAGVRYKITYTLGGTMTYASVFVGTTQGTSNLLNVPYPGTSGVNTKYFTATGTTTWIRFESGGGTVTVDTVSVTSGTATFAGNVGIGTTSPEGLLHLAGDSAKAAYFGTHSTNASGFAAVYRKSRGTAASPTIVASGDDVGFILSEAYDGAAYREVAGIMTEVDGTPGASDMPGRMVFFTTPDGSVTRTERMRIDSAGRVGIGRTPTTNLLEVGGNASKDAAGDWLANSDLRIKTDIASAEGLELVNRLKPVRFRYTDEYRALHPSIEDRFYYNFVAQEFAEVFPDYVKGSGEFLENGYEILQLDPHAASIVAIRAIQELDEKVESLKLEVGDGKLDNEVGIGNGEYDNLTVYKDLSVIGKTTLGKTNVAGQLSVGIISFDDMEGSVNVLGTLKLQNALGGGVEIDELGNVKVSGDLAVEGKVAAREVEVENGLTLKDQATGEYYCLTIKNGELEKDKGKCEEKLEMP